MVFNFDAHSFILITQQTADGCANGRRRSVFVRQFNLITTLETYHFTSRSTEAHFSMSVSPATSFTVIAPYPFFSLIFCGTHFDLARRHQCRSALVLNQEHNEFRRLGLASVPPNDVNIVRTFVKGLTSGQGHFLSAPHLHHD